MAIYRGNGGAGDATGGVTVNEITALTLRAEDAAVDSETSATNSATSASSSATSATAAATSATNSATSASQSATSATNSANSATASAASATNSANSATASALSATASAASATDAALSATDAQTAQVAAETAQTASEAAQAAAATSASNAATSASNASTSASNAASSATASANSATASASSATDSANSATASANSATASANSASSAASSAAAAAASLDSFDDRYLGAKASAPTLDNDGNALVTGALYYDTTEGAMFVYDGFQWIQASSAAQAILTVYSFTATGGQTTFTGVDDNAATLSYTAGSIIVTLNGIFLENGSDYTATTGTSVVLTSGAVANDELNIYSFNTFDVANVQAIGDDRYVRLTTDQTVAGTKTLSSNPVLSAGTANGVTYLNGSKVLTSGSGLTFDGSKLTVSATSGETGLLTATSVANYLSIKGDTGGTTLWAGIGTDTGVAWVGSVSNHPVSFRQNNTEAMRLTSTGLGIGTSSPASKLHVSESGNGVKGRFTNGVTTLDLYCGGTEVYTGTANSATSWAYANNNTYIAGYVNGSEKMRLDSAGNLGLGVTPSGWAGTLVKAFQIADNGASLSSYSTGNTSGKYAILSNNAYYDAGGWKYAQTAGSAQYRVANQEHQWFTAPSGTAGTAISFTQAMTLDASGNLGIGTSSPGQKLEVYGTLRVRSATEILDISAPAGKIDFNNLAGDPIGFSIGSSERLRIDSSGNVGIGTSSPNAKLFVAGAGDVVTINASASGQLLRMAQSSANPLIVRMVNNSGNFWDTQVNTDNSISWDYNDTERMRIDPSGNLLVGTTTGSEINAGKLRVVTNLYTAASFYSVNAGSETITVQNDGTSGTRYLFWFAGNSGGVGSITHNGTSTSYNTSSDYRLKEDWQPMVGASERVKALKPVNFAWKSDGSRVDGFLAHEAQAVVPEAVTGEKDAVELVDIKDEQGNVTGQEERPVYQGIDQSKLVPLLTAALQEALAQIESLTARVSALEGN